MVNPASISNSSRNQNIFSKLIMIRNEMVSTFVERENEIVATLVSLVSGEPMIMVGEPGTSKTSIIDALANMINAKYFYYLLTRFTEPDELLGVIDIKALREKGEYRRITANRLPEADLVFLDEIFKASSSIRNILLDIILNKRFLNGTQYQQLPMLALYTASNELELSTDEDDMAFYDRLMIRVFVNPVSMNSWKELLIKGIQYTVSKKEFRQIMTREDVLALREIAMSRAIRITENTTIMNKLLLTFGELENNGIHLSDRRKVKTLIVIASVSLLYMEKEPSLDSVADAIRYVAVHNPEDTEKVEKVIMKLGLSSFFRNVQRLETLKAELENALKELKEKQTLGSLKRLQLIYKQIVAELKRMPKNPRMLPYIREMKKILVEAKNTIDEYISGLNDLGLEVNNTQ